MKSYGGRAGGALLCGRWKLEKRDVIVLISRYITALNVGRKIKETIMEGWKNITKKIFIKSGIRSDGIFIQIGYNDIYIARVRYDGKVEFVNKDIWKKGWEFKVTYTKTADFIQFWKKK